MQYYYYIFLFLLFFVIFRAKKNTALIAARAIVQNQNTEGKQNMIELAKRFIGKECLIYAFDGNHQFTGIIREVTDGAILLDNNNTLEAINLDFVIRIREYPKNKKGKKKSVVVD